MAAPYAGNLNMGWPCYEGGLNASGQPTSFRYGQMDNLNLNLCETLYSQGTGGGSPPYWAYRHGQKIVTGRDLRRDFGRGDLGHHLHAGEQFFPGRLRRGAVLR